MANVASWLWRQRIAALGVGLAIAGAAVFFWSRSSHYARFAYTPLSQSVLRPRDAIVVNRESLMGLFLLGVGLMLLAGGIGYRLGARRQRER